MSNPGESPDLGAFYQGGQQEGAEVGSEYGYLQPGDTTASVAPDQLGDQVTELQGAILERGGPLTDPRFLAHAIGFVQAANGIRPEAAEQPAVDPPEETPQS